MQKLSKFIIGLIFMTSTTSCATVVKPKSYQELSSLSVKIVNMTKNSGGTGSILDSDLFTTKILTNKHVCRLIEQGGYVVYKNENIPIVSYKKYKRHDLCLVQIYRGLGLKTELTDQSSLEWKTANVVGQPLLLPTIVTRGHFSEKMLVQLSVGYKKCDKDTPLEYERDCLFFGYYPVIVELESQLVSATVYPGSSGSAVFDQNGLLSGVVFAGYGRDISYGFIVPVEYVDDFIKHQSDSPWIKVGTKVDNEGLFERIFNYESICRRTNNKLIKSTKTCQNLRYLILIYK